MKPMVLFGRNDCVRWPVFLGCIIVFVACIPADWPKEDQRPPPVAAGTNQISTTAPTVFPKADERGRFLAHAVCSTCHLFPEPDLLTKKTWVDGAFHIMAPFLGLAHVNLENRPDGKILKEAGVFPETPWLSRADWESIVAFYTNAAPVAVPPTPKITARSTLFAVRPLLRSPEPPCTTLLQIDGGNRRFYVGDAQTRTLRLVNSQGAVLRQCETDSGPVALNTIDSKVLVTLIGRILPSDELAGQFWQLSEEGSSWSVTRLLRGLRRPVHTALLDLDNDGRAAAVISCFGNRLGELALYRPDASGRLRQDVIAEGAGIVRCLPYDWNGDGLPDLTVLRAQAREGADIYINKGHGQFERHVLWDDPPAYGNVYCELVDFDRDGRPELLVVNGDNGDFPSEIKPYHGIRIFSVDQQLHADLKFRFLFPGAYAARADDFDMDGAIDIAAISFFPDYQHTPEQSFVFLHNDGNWKFTPSIVPGLTRGRWILMDAGDIDGDGDIDLLLGSFVLGPTTVPIPTTLSQEWDRDKVAVVLLENRTRNAHR